MAKIGNEAKLILKLAKERAKPQFHNMPSSYTDDDALKEAYTLGMKEGMRIYSVNLDLIISDIEG